MALRSSPDAEPHIAHFRAIPWTNALLTSAAYVPTPTLWRRRKPSTEDELLAVTLNTPATIPHLLALYRVPAAPSTAAGASLHGGIQEMKLLVTLGAGVNGWPGISHGGVIATLLDEFMGALINVHRKERVAAGLSDAGLGNTLTARLEVEYKAPVQTPGTYVITVEFEKVDGRKLWIAGRFEDKDGKVCVRSRALFLVSKTDLSKARI